MMKLPIDKDDDFTIWFDSVDYIYEFLHQVAISIILISVQILKLLAYQFPAFGVLFDTISKSKNDV
jgi:hypothetical protein